MSEPKPLELPQETCGNEDADSNHICFKQKGHKDGCFVEPRPTPQADGPNAMTDERLESIYHAATVNGFGCSFSSDAVVSIIERLRRAEAQSQPKQEVPAQLVSDAMINYILNVFDGATIADADRTISKCLRELQQLRAYVRGKR